MSLLDVIIRAFLLLAGSCVLLFLLSVIFGVLYAIDDKFNSYAEQYLSEEKGKMTKK